MVYNVKNPGCLPGFCLLATGGFRESIQVWVTHRDQQAPEHQVGDQIDWEWVSGRIPWWERVLSFEIEDDDIIGFGQATV